jgi:hypothetical protein
MSLGPGPYFFTLFGVLGDVIPLATSPVASYKAPDGLSSWTALGIHGYVERYNERLAVINSMIEGAHKAGRLLDQIQPSDAQYEPLKETLLSFKRRGIQECIDYVDTLAATRDSVAAGCAQLGVPLPRHGSTAGMKPVYTLGIEIPQGSWPAT